MNTKPFSDYLKAINAFNAADVANAEKHLAESLGLAELTPIMKSSLKGLCDIDNPNIVMLTLLMEATK